MEHAPQSFQKAAIELKSKLLGVQSTAERWKDCTNNADGALAFATGALYVDRYLSDADRLRVTNKKAQLTQRERATAVHV